MGQLRVTRCEIEGLCLLEPEVHGDARGAFVETWNARDMAAAGLTPRFVQDNQSCSAHGVLRGLHFQRRYPQGKLVRVVSGAVFDVAVDLRPGSATWGQWHGEWLTGENLRQLYIPEGFAHGFYVRSARAVFCYKCTDFYHPGDEAGLLWNDPALGVAWPIPAGETPLLSERDRHWPGLEQLRVSV